MLLNDFVTLHPSYTGCDEIVQFFKADPVKVLEVTPVTDNYPYTFNYFLENRDGERIFLDEKFLLCVSAERDEPHLSVTEYYSAVSEYDVGDEYFGERQRGVIVAVDDKYDKDNLPYFSYLVEFSDRTRRRFYI